MTQGQSPDRQVGPPGTGSAGGSLPGAQPNGGLRSAPDPQASRAAQGRRGGGAARPRGTSKRSRGAARDKHLRYWYGITLADYKRLFEAQGGRCAVCRIDYLDRHGTDPDPVAYNEGRRALAVDHDHRTGQIRGLLCVRHNRALTRSVDDYLAAPPAAGVLDRDVPEAFRDRHTRRRVQAVAAVKRRQAQQRRVFTPEEERTIRILLHFRRRSIRSLAKTYQVSEYRIREIRDRPLDDIGPPERTSYTYGDDGLKTVRHHT